MMRLSLMADQWKALVRNVQINGSPVNIMPVHYIGYGGFYDEIIEMAEQLSNDGICPHPIDRNKLIQPLFLNVVYKGHRMIVGIYDIASYKPDKPFELWNRYLKYAIDNSDADLFLFDSKFNGVWHHKLKQYGIQNSRNYRTGRASCSQRISYDRKRN